MAAEDLPNNFDIIVLGTGLTETIAAAAFSRIGLKVLHLDRNDFYGGAYGNFNLEGLETWKKKNNDLAEQVQLVTESDIPEDVKKLLQDGEKALSLPAEQAQAFHVRSQFHVRERTAEEEAVAEASKAKSKFKFAAMPFIPKPEVDQETCESNLNEDGDHNKKPVDSKSMDDAGQLEKESAKEPHDASTADDSGPKLAKDESSEHSLPENIEEKSEDNKQPSADLEMQTCGEKSSACADSSDTTLKSEPECEKQSQTCENEDNLAPDKPAGMCQEEANASQCVDSPETKEWTVGDIRDEWRRYCFDISPRVLYCCGEVIDLLIQSDVARYCEFRTVSRVLTLLKDKLQQVPCSRADVFSSKTVSLIEKRLMMKFLQFAVEYDKNPEEYQNYIGKPFVDFLKSKKLTANIQHFVQHAIAMATDETPTEDGLKKTQKFLHSLGRYGNTAFLFPLYGVGELPQAFSRLSAVFGGTYCLMLSATHLITDSENKCCGIITSAGQNIKCKYLIAESSYLSASYARMLSSRKISRAIFITESSILPAEEPELSLLNFVGGDDRSRPVTVLELPPSACVCPKNVFVVHLMRVSAHEDAEQDFQEVKARLFAAEDSDEGKKPKILWSMYFTQDDKSKVELSHSAPKNVLVTSGGGDAGVDLDFCVEEAKGIFHSVCPDEEFLPKPPNPEDIIHVDDTEAAVASGQSEFESKENEDLSQHEEGVESQKAGDENAHNVELPNAGDANATKGDSENVIKDPVSCELSED